MVRIAFLFISVLVFGISGSGQVRAEPSRFSNLDVLERASFLEAEMLNAAKRHGVDPRLLWTIAYLETRFRPWLTSPKGARGLMQFMPATAARFSLRDPYEPSASINAAAKYVRYLSGLFEGRIESVLAAYNAGEGTVSAYLHGRPLRTEGRIINTSQLRTANGVPPYAETRNYVRQGLAIHRWLGSRQRTGPLNLAEDHAANASEGSNNLPTSAKPHAVFYDARSGFRYSLRSDNSMEKLPDPGAIVISQATRPIIPMRGRTTFFAERKTP